jgi:hypothetical protein
MTIAGKAVGKPAGLRTVAHGFSRGSGDFLFSSEPASAGDRAGDVLLCSCLSPAEACRNSGRMRLFPRLKPWDTALNVAFATIVARGTRVIGALTTVAVGVMSRRSHLSLRPSTKPRSEVTYVDHSMTIAGKAVGKPAGLRTVAHGFSRGEAVPFFNRARFSGR